MNMWSKAGAGLIAVHLTTTIEGMFKSVSAVSVYTYIFIYIYIMDIHTFLYLYIIQVYTCILYMYHIHIHISYTCIQDIHTYIHVYIYIYICGGDGTSSSARRISSTRSFSCPASSRAALPRNASSADAATCSFAWGTEVISSIRGHEPNGRPSQIARRAPYQRARPFHPNNPETFNPSTDPRAAAAPCRGG